MRPALTAIKPLPFMPVSSHVYSDMQQFLMYEALLLDHSCFDQWASMLARDITYKVCNCSGQDRNGVNAAEYMANSRDSLLRRLGFPQPPGSQVQIDLPETRRFVTNINVSFAHCRNNYEVVSYLRVARIRRDGTTGSVWSAERRDLLRATDRSFAISRREVLIDSIEPGFTGPALFL